MAVETDRAHAQRGAALASVLLALSLLLPLGALAVLQARVGLLTQQSLRGDAEALHAADAGLARACTPLDPDADPGPLSPGPDRARGTADAGTVPSALACGSPLPPPLRFALRLEAGTDGEEVVLVATGFGTRGASRTLEQRVRRTAPSTLEGHGWRER